MTSLSFYQGTAPSKQANFLYLSDIHKWFGDYELLEYNLEYIFEDLFPVDFPNDLSLFDPYLEGYTMSYRLVLDLFGFECNNITTFDLIRTSNWTDRFKFLDKETTHPYMTRIVQSLHKLEIDDALIRFVNAIAKEYLNGYLISVRGWLRSILQFVEKPYKNQLKWLLTDTDDDARLLDIPANKDISDDYSLINKYNKYIYIFFPLNKINTTILEPYEIRLQKYGFRLVDNKGTLEKTPDWKFWFKELSTHSYKFLEIRRIIEALQISLLGHYGIEFLNTLIKEHNLGNLPNTTAWLTTLKSTIGNGIIEISDMSSDFVKFYKNKIALKGLYISDIHKWFGDYKTLETNPDYMELIFPTRNITKEDKLLLTIHPILSYRYNISIELIMHFFGFDGATFLDTDNISKLPNYKDRFKVLSFPHLKHFIYSLDYLDSPITYFFELLNYEFLRGNLPHIGSFLDDIIGRENIKIFTKLKALQPYRDEIIEFYQNKIPDLDNKHLNYYHSICDYDILEKNNVFIYWLFPINTELTTNTCFHEKYMKSYNLMLDFYGFKLIDSETGTLAAASNWEKRLKHLSKNPHNFLRINIIIQSLIYNNYEHYATKFMYKLIEDYKQGALKNAGNWLKILIDNFDNKVDNCSLNWTLSHYCTQNVIDDTMNKLKDSTVPFDIIAYKMLSNIKSELYKKY